MDRGSIADYRRALRDVEEIGSAEDETEERFAITNLHTLAWLIRRTGELEEEIAKIDEARRMEKAEIDLRADILINTRQTGIDRLMDHYGNQAEAFVMQEIRGKKRRSVSTLWGPAGYRLSPGKVNILNKDQAVASAKERDIEIKVEEKPLKIPIKEFILRTGEIPPGVSFEAPGDRFYLRYEPRTEGLFEEPEEQNEQ